MESAGHDGQNPPTADAAASLERIGAAVRDARTGPAAGAPPTSSAQFLVALALLRELRGQIAAWEPDLIDAARSHGASWAQLAPALGVASRQAAERRYLRLRPSAEGQANTGDQRVAAERDKRAADRAVNHWARDNAAGLRQLAGQISALTDLPAAADTPLEALRAALGENDAADLLAPLADTLQHLAPDHPALAAQVRGMARDTASVRRDTRERRRGPDTP
ncbi:MAG TPA: HSP18 transcriptional regulator [Actinocrinis sp.]|jgi:hypothetical protein|uniref:HSP18 transcriptional regulator n=1 Tax=Actinocrinis sp. TaxID=1920516 RepID=UPI002DDD4071|nr:HSP18 transcriptional regulator [Actinocrinis sp.]HEV3169522.1 HSP18 transcriptional regulator [Actinocrinis sp.]